MLEVNDTPFELVLQRFGDAQTPFTALEPSARVNISDAVKAFLGDKDWGLKAPEEYTAFVESFEPTDKAFVLQAVAGAFRERRQYDVAGDFLAQAEAVFKSLPEGDAPARLEVFLLLERLKIVMAKADDYAYADRLLVELEARKELLSAWEYGDVMYYKVRSALERFGVGEPLLACLQTIEVEYLAPSVRQGLVVLLFEHAARENLVDEAFDLSAFLQVFWDEYSVNFPKDEMAHKKAYLAYYQALALAVETMAENNKQSGAYIEKRNYALEACKALELNEEIGKIWLSEGQHNYDARALEQAREIFTELGQDYHLAEVAIADINTRLAEALPAQTEAVRVKAQRDLVLHWRVLEERLGESLAIFFTGLDKLLVEGRVKLNIEKILKDDFGYNEVLKKYFDSLPPNIKDLAKLVLRLFGDQGVNALDVVKKLSDCYWSHPEVKESITYKKRQCVVISKSELDFLLADKWRSAPLEAYLATLKIPSIPHPDHLIVNLSDDAEIVRDGKGKITAINGGRVLGTQGVSAASAYTTTFIFSGFDPDNLAEQSEAAMSKLGISVEDCLECGNLATFSIARGDVIEDQIGHIADEVLKAGKTHGMMVTHRAAEMMAFRRQGMKKGEHYFVVDELAELRSKPEEYDEVYKERIRDASKQHLGLDDYYFELWWERYINNPKLPVFAYIVDAQKIKDLQKIKTLKNT